MPNSTMPESGKGLITSGRLKRRAFFAFAVPLVLLFAASVLSVVQHREAAINARYVVALSQLVEGMAKLDGYVARIEVGRAGDPDVARSSYVDALGLYGAMRAADPDGNEIMELSESAKRRELSDRTAGVGIDPIALGTDLGLIGAEMPKELADIWEEDDRWASAQGDTPTLEATFGATLLAAAPIFVEGIREPAAIDRFWNASNELSEQNLANVADVLQRASAVASRTPIMLALLVLAITFGAAAASWFFVTRPLLGEIIRTQTALEQEAAVARAANRAKTEFLANITHELRTPMNGVLGVAQLLETQELDDDGREMLDVLKASAMDQVCLINELLDITKIESGSLSLTVEPFDPGKVVQDVVSIIMPSASMKGIVLDLMNEQGTEYLMGDPGAFRRICMNLVSNAVKFTETGTVSVDFSVRQTSGSATLSFDVVDTGRGISEADQLRIFDRFVQVDTSLSRSGEGTGLGLAISKALIDLMHGRIHVESEPGRGSRFRVEFELPVAETDERRAA